MIYIYLKGKKYIDIKEINVYINDIKYFKNDLNI